MWYFIEIIGNDEYNSDWWYNRQHADLAWEREQCQTGKSHDKQHVKSNENNNELTFQLNSLIRTIQLKDNK